MLEVIPFFRLYAQYVNKFDLTIVDTYKQTQPAVFRLENFVSFVLPLNRHLFQLWLDVLPTLCCL